MEFDAMRDYLLACADEPRRYVGQVITVHSQRGMSLYAITHILRGGYVAHELGNSRSTLVVSEHGEDANAD